MQARESACSTPAGCKALTGGFCSVMTATPSPPTCNDAFWFILAMLP